MNLFPEWYVARHLGLKLNEKQSQVLEETFRLLVQSALAQPVVYVHRDYMPRNLMVSDPNPGVLDFQDAVLGPITYDMVCLMRDAFISWEEERVLDWSARYWEKAKRAGLPVAADFAEFWRAFEWMGLQRHLKVLGIFARINYRDGKPKYLEDTPRFVKYAKDVAQALCRPRARWRGCWTSSHEGHAPRRRARRAPAAAHRLGTESAGRGGRQAAHRLAPRAARARGVARGGDQRLAPGRAHRRAPRRRRALRAAPFLFARARAPGDRGRHRQCARAARARSVPAGERGHLLRM